MDFTESGMRKGVVDRRLIALIIVLLILPVNSALARQNGNASQVIQLVNQYRANLGLPALQTNASLVAAAQGHVDWMVRTNTYGHTGEGGTTPTDRAYAAGYPRGIVYENWVSAQSPENALDWWDHSPVHQTTLRLPDAVDIGVGYNDGVYVLMMAWTTGAPVGGDDGPTETPGPVVIPVSRAVANADGSIVHVVQEGQSLWDIAAVYGVDLGEIERINNIGTDRIVHPGDQIIVKLAEGQLPPPTPTPPTTHVVQEGETAWTVAALHGLTLDQLLDLNAINRQTVLRPGDVLLIRQPDPTATETPTPAPTETPLPVTPTLTPSLTPAPSDTPPPSLTPSATIPLPTNPTAAPTVTPPSSTSTAILTLAAVLTQTASAPTATRTPFPTPQVASRGSSKHSSGNDAILLGAIILIAGLGVIMVAAGAAVIFRRQ
jgi:LysM repeat protein